MSKILKNSIFKIILTICNIAIPVIVMPYVLRVIDREAYDIFNYTTVNCQLFLTLGAFGVYNYGIREIAKVRDDKVKSSKLLSELFFLGVITNILFSTIYFTIIFFIGSSNIEKSLYYILGFQFIMNIFNIEWVNEANEKYSFITIKSVIVKIAYLLFCFLFIKKNDDIVLYTIIFTGTQVANVLLSFLYVIRKNKITIHKINVFGHLKKVFYVFLMTNIAVLFTMSSKLALGNFVDKNQITIFQVSYSIVSMIYTIFISIAIVSVPQLAKNAENYEEFDKIYKRISRIFLLIYIPACFGMISIAPEIILIYGGEKYLDCVHSLILFSIFHYVSGKCYLLNDCYLFVKEKEKVVLLINLIGGLVNIILIAICILLGVYNAYNAIAILIGTYVIIYTLSYIYIRKVMRYNVPFLYMDEVISAFVSAFFIPISILYKMIKIHYAVTTIMVILTCTLIYGIYLIIYAKKKYRIDVKKIRNYFLKNKKRSD